MEPLKPWTVKQLNDAYRRDLNDPNLTSLERDMIEIFARRELREFVAKLTRKLTPGEVAILDSWGINH